MKTSTNSQKNRIVHTPNNMTLLQTSEIVMGMGKVDFWSDIYVREVIRCVSADFVTRIEATPKWS